MEETKNFIVYCITNKVNGKQYIGQTTKTAEERFEKHKNSIYCPRQCITQAMRKYGCENFEVREIARASNQAELDELEERYIREWNTLSPNGYNVKPGGLPAGFTEETRKKIRESNLGKKRTEETRRKLSEIGKGRHLSEEAKRKVSAAMKGRDLGKRRSEETKQKLRDAWTRRDPVSEETKQKLREASKHRPPVSDETRKKIGLIHKGKVMTPEQRQRMSESHIGKPSSRKGCHLSEETRAKISKANKGNKGPLGHKWSDEARRRISIARTGKRLSEQTRQRISSSVKDAIEKRKQQALETQQDNQI